MFWINPSCKVSGDCESAQGNSVNISVSGNTVTLAVELRNSYLSFLPLWLDVNISFNVSVSTTPNGIAYKGTIDPYPSFELTTTIGGVTRLGPTLREDARGARCLAGFCGTRSFQRASNMFSIAKRFVWNVFRIAIRFVWNLMMAAVVWLPAFLIATQVELYVKEQFQYDNLARLLYDQVFMFVVLGYPAAVASIIFTASSAMVPFAWSRAGGLWTILLSSVLFLSSATLSAVLLAGHEGLVFVFQSLPASLFASLLFGIAVGKQERKPPINDSQIKASKTDNLYTW